MNSTTMNTEYEARGWYLYVKPSGEFDLQEALDQVPLVFQHCIDHGLHKVLVDMRELGGESFRTERYFYFDGVGKHYADYVKAGYPRISVAYAGSSEFLSGDGYEERVASLYKLDLKTTTETGEGLEWLKAQ
jgi:hypothetical protein